MAFIRYKGSKLFYFVSYKKVVNMLDDYSNIDLDLYNIKKKLNDYRPENYRNDYFDVRQLYATDRIDWNEYRKQHDINRVYEYLKDCRIRLDKKLIEIRLIKFWNKKKFEKYDEELSNIKHRYIFLKQRFDRLKKDYPIKEIKRVYSALDPYGEEDWEN